MINGCGFAEVATRRTWKLCPNWSRWVCNQLVMSIFSLTRKFSKASEPEWCTQHVYSATLITLERAKQFEIFSAKGSFSLALSLSRLCWSLFHNHSVRQWWNAKVCIRSNMQIFQKYVNMNFANAAYKTINVNNIILKLIILYVKHYILYIVTC